MYPFLWTFMHASQHFRSSMAWPNFRTNFSSSVNTYGASSTAHFDLITRLLQCSRLKSTVSFPNMSIIRVRSSANGVWLGALSQLNHDIQPFLFLYPRPFGTGAFQNVVRIVPIGRTMKFTQIVRPQWFAQRCSCCFLLDPFRRHIQGISM